MKRLSIGAVLAFIMVVIMSFIAFVVEQFERVKPKRLKMNLQMFAVSGKSALIKIGANTIQGLNEAKFSVNGDTIDVTNFASGGWIEKIQGLKSAELSISGFFLTTDATGQTALRTAFLAGTPVTIQALLDGTAGWSGSFMITKFEDGATVAGEISRSISMESTGAITAV